MADEKDKLNVTEAPKVEELGDEALADIAGGGLRDKVYVTPTTDISDDTASKI